MSHPSPHDDVPRLEDDETVPPRPEEAVADVARAEPATGTVPPAGTVPATDGPRADQRER